MRVAGRDHRPRDHVQEANDVQMYGCVQVVFVVCVTATTTPENDAGSLMTVPRAFTKRDALY